MHFFLYVTSLAYVSCHRFNDPRKSQKSMGKNIHAKTTAT